MSYETIAHEIDTNKTKFIDRLRTAVEIPSISADPEHREDVFRMIDWAQKQMETLEIKCEQIENGIQKLDNGQTLKLPPVLFGTLETSTHSDKHKKTLLVYGHLDVQPARLADGWNTEPFQLVEKDDKLYGRGSTDDKGPILAWLNAIETMQHLKIDIPVNIKFVLEGMEESGSEGLDDILKQHQHTFLADVDMVCISDNYWLGKKKPCITYGLRGLCYYAIEISEPKQDLHSGVFGGTIHEPMNDLVWIMSRLQDLKGKILIDGIYDLVAPLTKEEEKTYDAIDFDLENYKQDLGVNKLTYDTKNEVLMYRWRFPSLSIHGIEGAFSGAGAKTVIPAKVIGKFSIRLVPDMEPEKVDKLVIDYLNKVWKERGSPAKFKPIVMQGAKSWVEDFKHPHYQAGARALKKVFGVDPDFVREGCSIPVTLTFQELTKKNVMLLPIGACDDMAHSQNEKINISNYIEGTKALAAYLLELAHV